MTLRQMLGGDAKRLHELLEELLDREDGLILLFDGQRAVNYIGGFGLSPCQHELVAADIERVVRAAGLGSGRHAAASAGGRCGRSARDRLHKAA